MQIRLQTSIEYGNCKADADKTLDVEEDNISPGLSEEAPNEIILAESMDTITDTDETVITAMDGFDPTALEEYSNVYVAGYLSFKLLQLCWLSTKINQHKSFIGFYRPAPFE